jgi:hypothetical protein
MHREDRSTEIKLVGSSELKFLAKEITWSIN